MASIMAVIIMLNHHMQIWHFRHIIQVSQFILFLCSFFIIILTIYYYSIYSFMLARINHETLPISQAEFAQLVAESMATSRGPHHHHPPNTDRDYEGPEHWAKESAHHHRYHRQPSMEYDHDNYSPYQHSQQEPQYAPHHAHETRMIDYHLPGNQAQASHYQTEERVPESGIRLEYARAPVYETGYGQMEESPSYEHETTANGNEQHEQVFTYGGKPEYNSPSGNEQYSQYDDNYEPAANQKETSENGPNYPQPVYQAHDPPTLAYHRDFSQQFHQAQNNAGRENAQSNANGNSHHHQKSYHRGHHHVAHPHHHHHHHHMHAHPHPHHHHHHHHHGQHYGRYRNPHSHLIPYSRSPFNMDTHYLASASNIIDSMVFVHPNGQTTPISVSSLNSKGDLMNTVENSSVTASTTN